jgi:hypothetical protein
MLSKAHKIAAAAAVAAMTAASQAHAYRQFDLNIQNVDSKPVTITLLKDIFNCYEGSPNLGETASIPAGGRYTIHLARVQGHGCDGKQGEFGVQFSPGAGDAKDIQRFDFDNDGGLNLSGWYPNRYPGTLMRDPGNPANYVYTTWRPAAVTATGPSVGTWMLMCQQICNRILIDSTTFEHTVTNSTSQEVKTAVTASFNAGVKFDGVEAGGGVSTTQEKTIGQSMADSIMRGQYHTDTQGYVLTPEQMTANNIFALWLWIATTPLSDGEVIVVPSAMVTCTPDGRKPQYLPGSDADLRACRGARSAFQTSAR